MKVFELMAALAKCPAGAYVTVANNSNSYYVQADSIDDSSSKEFVCIVGDGVLEVTEEDENPEPPKRKK
jgi:hypothetical protein